MKEVLLFEHLIKKYFSTIKYIETYLPKNYLKINSLRKSNPTWDTKKIINKTGIERIWFTNKNQTALDLGIKAAKKILRNIIKIQ